MDGHRDCAPERDTTSDDAQKRPPSRRMALGAGAVGLASLLGVAGASLGVANASAAPGDQLEGADLIEVDELWLHPARLSLPA